MKNSEKTENNVSNATFGRHTRPDASTSGFPDSPQSPPSVDALGYVPAHQQGERNGRQVWYFFVVFFGIRPRRLTGAIRPEYSPDGGV
jgi:hypothetical protein